MLIEGYLDIDLVTAQDKKGKEKKENTTVPKVICLSRFITQ